MTNQSPEQTQEVSQSVDAELHTPSAGQKSRLIPVSEAIKYRRRAQQAESVLQQFEQRLEDTQAQLEERLEQLAKAESQRDASSR